MQGGIWTNYKQTELGVIPEDWQASTLGEVVEFLDGKRRPVKSGDRARMRGIYPYYGVSGIVDYVNGYLFDEGLILLDEDGENIHSRNLPLAFRVSGKIWVNNHAHVMRPSGRVDIGDLAESLESIDYSNFNSGTAQSKLNKQSCVHLRVVVPSLPEQRAIAAALSDADALIAALEGMIAKKRDLKQAAMQHLLTGKTRLPGFSGEWHDFTLHDACIKIQDGTHFSPKMGGNDFPYITSKNVGFGRMELSQVEWISAAKHAKICSRCNVRRGDLLLTKDGANTGNAAVNPFAEPISLLSSVAFCGLTKTGTVPTFFFTRYCPPKANARSSGK